MFLLSCNIPVVSYDLEFNKLSSHSTEFENNPNQYTIIESVQEISNNAVCATDKASDQPAHTRSLIRAFASRLSIL